MTKKIIKRYPESASFSMFWEAYPRKEGKLEARESWEALDPSDALVALMIRAIGRQKESQQWRDPSFIPHPTTWLNNHRWESEMAPASTLSKQGQETLENARAWLSAHKNKVDAPRLDSGKDAGAE